MADFTSLNFELNTQSTAIPAWQVANGVNHEVRFYDGAAGQQAVASASWPFSTRPAAGTAGVDYIYVFTADATGFGSYSGSAGGNAAGPWSNNNYLQARWNWDALGTFASAPIFTAYPSTAHGAVTRGDGSLLGGHVSDTGATARSYLKGQGFGRVDSAGVPAAAPANAPTVTDGATGALTPTAGANWLTNYQSLQGDNDWIAFPSTPAATVADKWSVIFRLFYGQNMNTGLHVPVISLKYTWV